MNLGDKLKPCPFCKRNMVFHKCTYTNKYGKKVTEQYYMHEDYDVFREENCLLDELRQPFTIGAGDADEETGYIGEYAEKWNKQLDSNFTDQVRIIHDCLGEAKDFAKEVRGYLYELEKQRPLTKKEEALGRKTHNVHIHANDSRILIQEQYPDIH